MSSGESNPRSIAAGSAIAGHARDDESGPNLRQSLRIVTIAWIFGAAWLWIINGAVMNRFAKSLGMPDAGFGLLAALPFLGSLFQLPATYLIARFGHRRQIFLWCGSISRMLWGVAALVPWVLPSWTTRHWPIVLLLLFFSWGLINTSTPAWINWMSDLVPGRIRGRYFARRVRIGQITGLFTTIAIGLVMDVLDQHGHHSGQPDGNARLLLQVTSTLIAVAGLLGLQDVLCFRRLPDTHPTAIDPGVSWKEMAFEPLRDEQFRRLLVFTFMLNLGIGFMGHYIMLYLYDVIGLSNAKVNLLLIMIPLLVQATCARFWGRAIDRLGSKPVLVTAGLITVTGSIGWLFVQPGDIWLGYAAALVASMAWPGVELANFNVTLKLAERNHGSSTISGHMAINAFAAALGGTLSGLLAAVVASSMHDFRWTIPVLNLLVTYHGVLFILSTVIRILSLIAIARFHEPTSAPTRDAIRYISDGLWSTVRQGVIVPTRVASHVVRHIGKQVNALGDR